ncbi:MAG: 3-isopropylmalate dehydratase small subunit [Syntrophales bacterium]|jgi:3-isopropylmalate dehydratase small subunit|nr:3-isopropylmalate dehydratase small subunit [Syntrophales bacterium]MCK9528239.1 3-isopropylmalate dehydratase small subunit [Syntrophales bacterium]MDX9922370.1 3-isopropylmalate dehydratase small subunit [Syntrophales bacterium]
MVLQGIIWKFGDDVDTDLIIPAKFLNVSEPSALARNCFADLRPDFASSVQAGDILVAGSNFGCGSSREHAPLAIKTAGISLVIAGSFARIFYRNAFNIGLPLIESTEAAGVLADGEEIRVDLSAGTIVRVVDDRHFTAKPVPDFMAEIIQAGGLVPYTIQQDRIRTGR